jgi:uncharacterized damage-inducible protein DinB
MTELVDSIRGEFLRYKGLAEAAMAQLDDAELSATGQGSGNSIAIICWHISGNLRSRFSDFLTSDGEKPWRGRDEEFEARTVTRAELLAKWQQGWDVLIATLAGLTDDQLGQTVTIRGQTMRAHAALHRALAHITYHVGQIVYLAKAFRGGQWTYLSIPPGQSAAYNQNPSRELPAAHAEQLRQDRP